MNRRNFILGLGTAATLSGAASVTSASIQNTVEPGADFRIVSAEALDVRRNDAILENDETNVSNTNPGLVNDSDTGYTDGTEGDLNFSDGSDVYQSSGPNMTLDSGANGQLNMSLVTPNSNATKANRNSTFNGDIYYSGVDRDNNSTSGEYILEVENLGATSQNVGVSYNYGADASSEPDPDQVDASTVNTLFTFVNPSGDVISPTGDDGTHNTNNYLTVDSGVTKSVGLILNYSDSIENEMKSALDSGFGGSASNANLLNTVEFGTEV